LPGLSVGGQENMNTKALWLLTFTWMALTGSLMFFYIRPGQKAGGLLHSTMEIHEIGEGLIPVFLEAISKIEK
jgi:hypothetical protein